MYKSLNHHQCDLRGNDNMTIDDMHPIRIMHFQHRMHHRMNQLVRKNQIYHAHNLFDRHKHHYRRMNEFHNRQIHDIQVLYYNIVHHLHILVHIYKLIYLVYHHIGMMHEYHICLPIIIVYKFNKTKKKNEMNLLTSRHEISFSIQL